MNSIALPGARERFRSKTLRTSGLLNGIVATAAFLCTCSALHAVLPAPHLGEVGTKMRFSAAHQDEFDTIFVGSSRIYRGVSPSIFDEVMAKAGNPSHTFNFGINGMLPPERFYFLERILSMKSRKLKRVFVEIDDVQATWLPGEQTSQRVIYWHDWKRTWVVVRKILNLDVHEQWKRKLRLLSRWHETIALHLMLFAKNFGNFDRALDLAESFLDGKQVQWDELGPKLDGHLPIAVRISGEKGSAYELELAHEEAAHIGNVALDRYADQAYRHYARRIQGAGATPIFVVTPVNPQLPSQFSGPSPGLLLAYNIPKLYSDLYRAEARVDDAHLNQTGAEKFTRLLAEDFLEKTRQP
jgi:hypothetical protein